MINELTVGLSKMRMARILCRLHAKTADFYEQIRVTTQKSESSFAMHCIAFCAYPVWDFSRFRLKMRARRVHQSRTFK